MTSNKRKRDVTYGKQRPQQTRLDQLRQDMFNPDNDSHPQNLAPPIPPNKPRSQKEATMAVEPSDENVETVCSFTGCTKDVAIRYLKVKSNDADRAVNAILDGEDISKEEQSTQWDESAFSQDRDGNKSQDREGSLRPLGTSAAPTRGPSPAGSYRRPENQQQEDDDMAQALAASQQDAGGFQQQETGVVHKDGSSTSFGPATRAEYDAKEWAMVPSSSQASSEVVPDVDVEQRKNAPGEPRFLKHLPSGDYLPNFLTMCHAIPGVRDALLLREYVMPTYGSDPEWWRGHGIALPKIVHTTDGTPADPAIDRYDDLIAETQRLMATLDASERSYASASALANTEALGSFNTSGLEEAFVKAFIQAGKARCQKGDELRKIFVTEVGTTHSQGMKTPYLELVDMPVEVKEGEKVGLMELLDGLLWDTGDDAEMSDNYIERGADVLAMRPRQKFPAAGPLRIEAPSQLYLDKYLKHNVEVSKGMRLEIAEHKKKAARLDDIANRLQTWQHPRKYTHIESKAMIAHTLGHFSGKNMRDADEADKESGISVSGSTTPKNSHYADITRKLERITQSVDKKLEKLALEKDRIQEGISRLSNSSPPQLVDSGLKDRYTLMGVATKPSITYVLRPKPDEEDDELISLENDNDGDQTPTGMQWWRIEYAVNNTTPRIDKTKVPDYDVLRAIELEHNSALLIYASDRAIGDTYSHEPLPEPLQRFVQQDNKLFQAELQAATTARPPPAYDFGNGHDQPRPSIEHDSRRNSMDSTTAQGDMETPSFDDPAFDQHANFGLGPNITAGSFEQVKDDPEVAEIHLSPNGEDEGEKGTEMAEKEGHPGLFAGAQAQQKQADGDKEMEDVGVHVEDAGKFG